MTKILIVEDNELNLKLFYDILTYQKYDVIKANSVDVAYDLIKENELDLIILDLMLQDKSGFDLIDMLNNEKIQYPKIIITSACAMDDDKAKAKQYGINTYITKPIDINKFIKTIKENL